MTSNDEPIDFHHIKKAALIIRALNNAHRQKIYNFLITADNYTVTDIVTNIGLEQSVISQHLAILRRAKIVAYLKKGKFVYYHINKERVVAIQGFVDNLLKDNKTTLLLKDSVSI